MNSYKLKDLIKIHNGTTYTHLEKGDIPLYGSGGIMSYVNDYLYDGEAILLPRKGTLTNILYTNSKIWTVDTMYYATVKNDNISPYYLYSYLSLLDLKHLDSGSALPSMTKSAYENLEIKLPDFETQQKIASILSSLDKKIELNNQINQKLESMAKTLYDYWFVQFDFPDVDGKSYKSSGGKMVYSEELKREIPEGWEVDIIGNILSTVLGGTPSTEKEEYWNGDIPWLNSGEIANFPLIDSKLKITSDAIKKSATSFMPIGTVAISITRHLRPSILAIEACANQSVIGVLESDKIKSSYIYPFVQNEIPRYMTLRTGAQQPHINKKTIDETFLIVPDDEVFEKYYEIVNPMYENINNIAFQNQKLTQLRDWLLPMLMNGQVGVE